MAQGRAAAAPQIETIVAPATPAGPSAVSMTRLSGPRAAEIANTVLAGALRPREAVLAKALDGGRLLDRVVVTYYPGPRSYTGEDVVEISSHGSAYVRSRLLELLRERGARLAEPGEFTLRAYLHGKLDLAQAEGVHQLIASRHALAHRAALAALEGGLSSRVAALRDRALALSAQAEVAIDHPEEDVPLLDRAAAGREAGLLSRDLEGWLRRSPPARLLEDGLRVCILGRPNAGKSSLLNALLGRDRAIVHEEPGTTRDVLEDRVELDGLPVLLVDTAGIRGGTLNPAEAEGIARSRRAAAAADLCLLVRDSSRPAEPEDQALLAELGRLKAKTLVVLSKADLSPAFEPSEALAGAEWTAVSSLSGEGLEALCSRLKKAAMDMGAAEELPAANERQRAALGEAARAFEEARLGFESGLAEELCALHLREGLEALGRIAGGAASEDLLRTIFSRFCIGK